MLFHTFTSQAERREYGGSAFVELQFCRLPLGTDIKTIVAVDSIKNWQDDSLYVNNENLFYEEYSQIFNCGTYNNLQSGPVDVYGINYYAPEMIKDLQAKILAAKPTDCQKLLSWLEKAQAHNGFYILGI